MIESVEDLRARIFRWNEEEQSVGRYLDDGGVVTEHRSGCFASKRMDAGSQPSLISRIDFETLSKLTIKGTIESRCSPAGEYRLRVDLERFQSVGTNEVMATMAARKAEAKSTGWTRAKTTPELISRCRTQSCTWLAAW